MKIGIIGTGMIGSTLAERLAGAGHDVAIANSRGPETIEGKPLSTGARAVKAGDVATGVDALIVSVPLSRIPDIAPHVQRAPEAAVVIDTSNYYPMRDGEIEAIESGQVESLWVVEQLGRPVVKAWNAIGSESFNDQATETGAPGRIAIPVAGDDAAAKATASSLIGTLAEWWRQQPGTPAYCTDRTATEMPDFLAAADRDRAPRRRDLLLEVATERREADGAITSDRLMSLGRAIY
jgi:predicted dinucleotide-binding enzyme